MPIVVFDFDGTMADSLSVALEVYNQLANEKNLKPVTDQDWQKLRRMHLGEALKYSGIKPYQVPGLLSQGRKILKSRTKDIKLFNGIEKCVKQLSQNNIEIYVLSTNSKIVVEKVLKQSKVNDYVKVLRSAPIFGKAAALKKLMKQTGCEPSEVWMVGDELRDGQAAAKVGANFIAVNWGLQPGDILEQTLPKKVAMKPSDISKTILNG